MWFLPWHLAAAYVLDLLVGDPQWLPHPTRWIGRWIGWVEGVFYDGGASSVCQRLAGCVFWMQVTAGVAIASTILIGISLDQSTFLAHAVMIWLAYTTLATHSLYRESLRVVKALRQGDIALSRKRLAMIVSRDTGQLEEKDILRAVIETVAENTSDGIIAPLFFLALGGPIAAIAYKTVNTMDSMVGYQNDRYRYFGWCAARVDDLVNWVPARLSGMIIVAASACLKLDWRRAWQVMRRDARKMKSPNAGYPEAAAAGALGIQLGGPNVYFGRIVEKPTLGDARKTMTFDTYDLMIRLMFVSSVMAFLLAMGVRYGVVSLW
ncbi:MAG TPA: adenosylcobinamide-phosphate synthase CbiB [Syntrophobacteraceae bacterium]|nr:adenosylcobinamide-phosphate synthase CbiB [Syntrophobacteraceae bacterium]